MVRLHAFGGSTEAESSVSKLRVDEEASRKNRDTLGRLCAGRLVWASQREMFLTGYTSNRSLLLGQTSQRRCNPTASGETRQDVAGEGRTALLHIMVKELTFMRMMQLLIEKIK